MKKAKKEYIRAEDALDKLTPMQLTTLSDIYCDIERELTNEEIEKSLLYCKMAAEGGNPCAQTVLANAYASGDKTEQSEALALMWYHKAAEQGYPYAQYELGKRLQDEDGGLLWLHFSAKQGFCLAMKELSDRLSVSNPKAAKKWLKRYYRNKNKKEAWRWYGKKYMREFRRERHPEVINGEVVILL